MCKVSSPSNTDCMIACAQIAKFYKVNLHICIVKAGDLGAHSLTFGVEWAWNFSRPSMVMWWSHMQRFIPIRRRPYDCVHLNCQFLWREPTYLHSKKLVIWAHTISHSVSDGHWILHGPPLWWGEATYNFSSPSDTDYMIVCAQIANIYEGNLRICIVRNYTASHSVSDGHETLHDPPWW